MHLVMDDHELDLSQREADLAHPHARAGAGRSDPAQALHRALSHVRLARRIWRSIRAPKTLEEIGNHTIIVYGETAAPEIRDINWLLEHYKKHFKPGCNGRIIRINNITGILQAVEAGLGIGVVPDYVAADHPELVRVLPDVAAPGFDVHLVYADALRQSKRVAAFRDFLVKAPRTGSIKAVDSAGCRRRDQRRGRNDEPRVGVRQWRRRKPLSRRRPGWRRRRRTSASQGARTRSWPVSTPAGLPGANGWATAPVTTIPAASKAPQNTTH